MTNLNIKTQAAIQHLKESLVELTEDNLNDLIKELEDLVSIAHSIKNVSNEINY